MSRSYRAAVYVDGYGTKRKRHQKNQANRLVRRALDVPDGKAYRKFYNPWDITDYKFFYDPHIRYYCWGGEIKVVEPDPKWKIARK